ncbi:MAG: hypothetical protein AAF674_15525 [Pseudomonadota bacterium]
MELAGKTTLIGIQVTGLVISLLLFIVTFSSSDEIEERLREFAIAEVERAAGEVWLDTGNEPGDGSRSEKLMALSERLGLDAAALDAQRKQVVPEILALAKSETCQGNCEFWILASKLANVAMTKRIAQLQIGQRSVGDFLVERYEASVKGLLTDLRRFALVNALVLALMIGLVAFRNHLNWRFIAFSVALTTYTAWAAYGYVFNQNWALAILLHDWASPGYQAAMIFVSLLFFDWLFLRGQVTQAISNSIASALTG